VEENLCLENDPLLKRDQTKAIFHHFIKVNLVKGNFPMPIYFPRPYIICQCNMTWLDIAMSDVAWNFCLVPAGPNVLGVL